MSEYLPTEDATENEIRDGRINIVEAVNNELLNLGATLDYQILFQWTIEGVPIKPSDLADKIWHSRESRGDRRIAMVHIKTCLSSIEINKRHSIFLEFRKKLEYQPGLPDRFEELARFISQDLYEPMCPLVLRHVVWTVKRRLFQKKDYCPILLNIFGAAGSGKTEFVKAWFSVFPASLTNATNNAAELFNDERQEFRFVDNFLILLDELSNMNKADASKLKNAIDRTVVTYRQLGFNKTAEGRNNAQLIGTSNTRLRNTILVDSDLRKWCEIDMWAYPHTEVPSKMVSPLQEFDWLTLWRSIDENGPSPFQDPIVYESYCQWTMTKCLSETPTTTFIKSLIKQKAGEWIGSNSILIAYQNSIGGRPMGDGNFKDMLLKYGFNKGRKNNARGFIIPTPNQCKYFTEDDKLDVGEDKANPQEAF